MESINFRNFRFSENVMGPSFEEISMVSPFESNTPLYFWIHFKVDGSSYTRGVGEKMEEKMGQIYWILLKVCA